jgi:hypothetical protein
VNPRQAHALYLAFCLQRAADELMHCEATSTDQECTADFDSGGGKVYGLVADSIVVPDRAVAKAVNVHDR